MSELSAAADAVQGAKPENLSGGQDHKGSVGVQPGADRRPQSEEELKKQQGLGDDAEEDAKAKAGKDAKTDDNEQDDDPGVDDTWDGTYVSFNDESADSVVDLLKEANVGGREANLIFEEAIKADDLSKVKWDVLEEKLGAAKAKLAKIAITDYYNRVYSKNVATTKAVHEAVGGPDNWQKIAKWVRTTESKDPSRAAEFNEIRKGIDSGGKLATYATKELIALYEADTKNKGLGTKKVTRGDNASDTGQHGAPLSKAEYNAAIKKAYASKASPGDIAALRARRQAGMKAGR